MTEDTARVDVYLDKLKVAANARDEDPTELARLVRAVKDEFAQRPELSCSIEQEQLLVSTSTALLDQQLADLLKALLMSGIAPELVRNYLFDINTVARAIVSPVLMEMLPPNVHSRLFAKLEVRGMILNVIDIPSNVSWFNRLCEKLPTQDLLQQRTWGQLMEILELSEGVDDFPTPSQEHVVQQVWSTGHALREKILQYGLSPEFADILVSRGCQTLSELSEQDVCELQRGCKDDEKCRLRRLWRHESDAGQSEAKHAAQRRDSLRDQTKQAIDIIESMKRAVEGDQSEAVEKDSAELSELVMTLGMGEWKLPVENIPALTDELDRLALVLKNAATELGTEARDQYDTDEQVIAGASAGQALCGLSLGLSAKGLSQQPTRRLLQVPPYCPLLSPLESVKTTTVMFNSVSAAETFRSAVSSSGDTLMASLEASAWGIGGVKASGTRSKSSTTAEAAHQSTRTATAVALTYGVVPVKSLRISREQMKLSTEATDAIFAIATPENARRFLADFGSHVPTGVQHFGGIYWKIVEIHAEEEVEESAMHQALAKETSGSLSANLDIFACGSGGGAVGRACFSGSSDVSGASMGTKSYSVATRVECVGPNVATFEMFSNVLAINNQSWFLIDRGSPLDLVPVWDLIDDSLHSDMDSLSRIKSLLRDAWLDSVQHMPFTPDVRRMVYRERLARNDRAESSRLLSANKVEARNQVDAEIKSVCSLPGSTSADVLLHAVERMFAKIDRYDFQFDSFVLAETLREGPLPAFMEKIATKSMQENVQPLLSFLAMKLDDLTQQRLLLADPPVQLGRGILATLDNLKTAVPLSLGPTWHPQCVANLEELPSAIRATVDGLRESSAASTDLVTKRVGQLLVLNLWKNDNKSKLRDELLAVAERFLCSADGFLFPLLEESYEALLEEFERIISPSPSPSPVSFLGRLFQNPPVLSSVASQSEGNPYSYTRVDRPASDCQDLPKSILHTLTHRLDIQSTLYKRARSQSATAKVEDVSPAGGNQDARSRRAARTRSSASAPSSAVKGESVFDATIQLQASNDVAARSEVHRLLLDRRFLTPFIAPTSSGWTDTTLSCDIAALELVSTVIDHDGEDAVSSRLTSDMQHLRVAVISQRSKATSSSKDWIKMVFHVNSLHAMDCDAKVNMTAASTAAEIGWGFLLNSDQEYVPVVLLHVIGDYRPLKRFIASYCDAVVVDMGDSETVDVALDHGCVLKWTHADPDEDNMIESDDGAQVFVESLRCRFTESTGKITDSLLEEVDLFGKRNGRVSLLSAASNGLVVTKIFHVDFDKALTNVDFSNVRTELRMQVVFAKESQEALACQRENDPMKMRAYETRRTKLRELRQRLAVKSNLHPLITLFRSILQNPSSSARVIGVLDLERFLALRCEVQSALAHKAYRQARDAYHYDRNPANSQTLARALSEWDNQSVQLEHLWRELSQLYAIDPTNHGGLAMLAAQHLLDGFALELMDGDAGVVNLVWIEGVFNALKRQLSSAKVLVLSVMGVQSSGKSTLLNYMFGVRLRTSVSRCTRGVSIQLLKCEGRREYEYIILLDTEGIRAPERIGMEDGVWLDNRMATLSILPADATIILTKGESTITINEILPIVLSAYLESEVAQTYGGRLPSKLLFVFNQIDLAEKSKLENIVDSLMHELNANAKKVAEIRHGMHVRSADDASHTPPKSFRGANVFDDLNYAITDEENSDVRVLGTIKAQSYPPHDAPLPDYGQRLLQLREHIHRRVCGSGWKGRTIDEFGQFISTVWNCIECSNFQLNFIAAYERINYDKLVNRVNDCAHRLTARYCAAFDVISMEIRKWSDKDANNSVEALVTKFCDDLSIAIFNDVSNLDEEMQLILSEECFSKWATDQQSRWNRHKEDQGVHWRKLVQGQVDNVFRYDAFVGQYKMQLRSEANALFGNGGYRNFTEQQIAETFEAIFSQILRIAFDHHPPMYLQVPSMIEQVFHRTNIWALSRHGKRPPAKKSLLDTVYQNTLGKLVVNDQPRMEAKLVKLIINSIGRVLDTVNRYDDATVVKCIQITKSTLLDAEDEGTMRVTDEFKTKVYLTVKRNLCEHLKLIQCRWDEANGVAARFAASKDEMKTYFINLGKGYQGMRLLQNIVCDWLQRNIRKSFLEELVAAVGLVLKEKRWVSDAEVMQAMIDNSLVELIESKRVPRAIDLIKSPSGHIDHILSQLIRSEVERCLGDKLTQFVRRLLDCIRASAAKARQANKDRAVCFLSWLKSGLRDQLPTAATNCLLTSMPHANDGNINCDDQPAEIFDENDQDFVCKPIMDVVEQEASEILLEGQVDVTADVLTFIRSRAHGASSGVMPRCGEPCPICKSPCTRELGHVTTEDEKCHDTYHQPTGLTGWRDRDSRELSAGSCLANAQADITFSHTDGEYHPYKDYHKVFPNWSQPVEKQPLRLREYIFYKFQDDLVARYEGTKTCTAIPLEYNHSLHDIKETIATMIS